MLITDIKVLDQVLAINLDINLWSARRKLNLEDFGGVELPPEELASLGSKKICDPEELKIFSTLKARAFNFLDKHGIRFLGGWAIPEHKAEEIVTELVEIRRVFEANKLDFLATYDKDIQTWIAKHPKWSKIIADSVVNSDYVNNRMNFAWQIYRVLPLIDCVNPQTMRESGLYEEVENLGNTFFDEIAKTANDTWQKVFLGRDEVTHKALSPIKTLYNKIKNLSFIDPHLLPVAELIETSLTKINPKGNIQGTELLVLHGLISLLREPKELISQCQKIFAGENPSSVLDELIDSPAPIPMPVTQNQIASYGLW